ncbi:MAG: hypothetical protein V5A68_03325 [Candidatus Thermoplasmatota archaeon]
MSKRLKKIKATMLSSLLLIVLITAMLPSANAGLLDSRSGFVNLSSLVEVNWTSFDDTIIPKGVPAKPQIRVQYDVARGGVFPNLPELFYRMYQGERIDINLEIVNQPGWASVSLSTRSLYIIVGQELPVTKTVEMTIALDENAPALEQGIITLKASVPTLNRLFLPEMKGFEKTFDLTFTPDYLPVIDANPKGSNNKKIGPMESAVFPIEVTNEGNEKTRVFFNQTDVPEGWKAIMTDTMILNVNQTKTAYLSIQPPRGFGYHYDIENIRIEAQPARALNPDVRGKPIDVTVQIESRGISAVGGEVILPPIIATIAIIAIGLYYYKEKFRKKE